MRFTFFTPGADDLRSAGGEAIFREIFTTMAITPERRAELEAEIARLRAELEDAAEDTVEAVEELAEAEEEAAEAHEDAAEEIAEEVAEEVAETIHDAAEELAEASPILDEDDPGDVAIAEAEVAARVAEEVSDDGAVAVIADDAPAEVFDEPRPMSEHWSRRPLFKLRRHRRG